MDSRHPLDELSAIAGNLLAMPLLLAAFGLPHVFVHDLGHTGHTLSPIARAVDDRSPAPMVAALGAWALSIVADVVRMRRGLAPRSTWGPRSVAFLAGGGVLLAWLVLFWPLDGQHLPHHPDVPVPPFHWTATILGASLALQALADRLPRGWRLMRSLPPLAATAALLGLSRALFHDEDLLGLITQWLIHPGPWTAALASGAIACRWARAWGAWFLGAWALALWTAVSILLPFEHMCTKMHADPMGRVAAALTLLVCVIMGWWVIRAPRGRRETQRG